MDDPFTKLPEDFVSEIISRTSPLDASRLAVVSKGFKSAAESDPVWDKFLPGDCFEIVSTSVSPVVYSTKKELYFSLCHSPILLDAGNLIPLGQIEELFGYMDCRRALRVAKLKSVCWLDIRGKIKTHMLSSSTTYGAYLVFKLAERSYGLESVNAVVRFVNDEADSDAEERAAILHLQRSNARHGSRQQTGQLPVRRNDGWMEIEMGNFYSDKGDDGEAEARLIEIKRLGGKSGLIVQGIEFRPQA
ncbi:hypothetical protein DH2020_005160 [Rehmannia glutinosa]|uniref:F-box domain-containing protein n=1 Tax=Rehmannia glutinosa TaxID=99300 RepID=A0ABR0XRG5_REHGL